MTAGDVHDQYRFWTAVVAYLRAERVAKAIVGYQHKPKQYTRRRLIGEDV